MKKKRVGIDLAAASMLASAPGTAKFVAGQAKALLAMDVPWTWVPVFSNAENPLREWAAPLGPLTGRQKKFSVYASFELGRLWKEAGCTLGFSTAYFVPFGGPPVVANYFDANFFERVDEWHRGQEWLKHQWTRQLFAHSVKKAEKLFILSEYGRDRMASLFPGTREKWVVTSCGFTPPGPAPARLPAWARELKRPFFMYAGSFSDNKNQRTLLRAWERMQARFADAPSLVLIGPCGATYMEQVIAPLHRALPRPSEVILTGLASDEDVAWAYRNAHGYLQPSMAEGFGMPLLEAMSCGVPVACSNTTSLPDTAGGAAMLFDPRQPGEIEHAAITLWRDESARHALVASGVLRAENFTWKNNAEHIASAIHDLLPAERHSTS